MGMTEVPFPEYSDCCCKRSDCHQDFVIRPVSCDGAVLGIGRGE